MKRRSFPKGVFLRPVLLLVIAVGVPLSALGQSSTAESCTLLVRLYNEPFPDESEVPEVPLTFDARITLHAVIKKEVIGSCGFSPNDRVVFLIHSPSRTLGGYWFHDKDFFLTLEASDEKTTGRKWDLAGVDWPLSTEGPNSELLICSSESVDVRTLVGAERRMLGPFSVFKNGLPIVSLGTFEVANAHPTRGNQSFAIDYPGDPDGRSLKPRFRFEANQGKASIVFESSSEDLTCVWPTAE